jgi:membrane protease YdiL (CAAX protease family)
MRRLIDWIEGHQLTAFFALAFGITWGLSFTYLGFYQGMVWLMPLGSVALCGPALAGIIISSMANTQAIEGSCRPQWIAFAIAWLLCAPVFLAHIVWFDRAPLSLRLAILVVVSAAPVAFVVSMAYSRIPAVKRLLSSLVRLRGVVGWSLLALVFYPALILLAVPITSLIGRQPIAAFRLPGPGAAGVGLIPVKFLYQFFFFNAVGEEVGWRGFALPRLQARYSPLMASLIVALFWVPWHLLLWKAQGAPVETLAFWLSENTVLIILSSVITTYFYNRARGSILVTGILHAAGNSTARLLYGLDLSAYVVLKALVALVVVLVGRMWKRLPLGQHAVYTPQWNAA